MQFFHKRCNVKKKTDTSAPVKDAIDIAEPLRENENPLAKWCDLLGQGDNQQPLVIQQIYHEVGKVMGNGEGHMYFHYCELLLCAVYAVLLSPHIDKKEQTISCLCYLLSYEQSADSSPLGMIIKDYHEYAHDCEDRALISSFMMDSYRLFCTSAIDYRHECAAICIHLLSKYYGYQMALTGVDLSELPLQQSHYSFREQLDQEVD